MSSGHRRHDALFEREMLSDWLNKRAKGVAAAVDRLSADEFLAYSDDDLVSNFVQQGKVEPLSVYDDDDHLGRTELTETTVVVPDAYENSMLRVPGFMTEVSIQFTGNSDLWHLQPSSHRFSTPRGCVVPESRNGLAGKVTFVIAKHDETPSEEFNRDIDRNLDDIRFYIRGSTADIETYNTTTLSAEIRGAIESRRKRLEKRDQISEALDIPIKMREDAPTIRRVPIKEKFEPLPRPSGGQDWRINSTLFERIVEIIRHIGRAYERAPATFRKLEEEELRDIMVAHLNGYFKGGATAETFRGSGKTDILIDWEDRAAFVGECKIWKGAKALTDEAIPQLFSRP